MERKIKTAIRKISEWEIKKRKANSSERFHECNDKIDLWHDNLGKLVNEAGKAKCEEIKEFNEFPLSWEDFANIV